MKENRTVLCSSRAVPASFRPANTWNGPPGQPKRRLPGRGSSGGVSRPSLAATDSRIRPTWSGSRFSAASEMSSKRASYSIPGRRPDKASPPATPRWNIPFCHPPRASAGSRLKRRQRIVQGVVDLSIRCACPLNNIHPHAPSHPLLAPGCGTISRNRPPLRRPLTAPLTPLPGRRSEPATRRTLRSRSGNAQRRHARTNCSTRSDRPRSPPEGRCPECKRTESCAPGQAGAAVPTKPWAGRPVHPSHAGAANL